ncbi:MAG: NAD(P)H-dependent flavin oxidoreductase [Armatimonadota bacterium]|jgi:nitronate monooxygenase
MKLPALRIRGITINPPIIQGGMGVRVSGARLASAVANEGCAGVIASVGLGDFVGLAGKRATEVNREALRQEIRRARSHSDGVIGVNVMVALTDYDELVRIAAQEGADFIISGAGLPLNLPALVDDDRIALIPIVSSARALRIICSKWRQYGRVPDAVVVEGPKAGGHLGFSRDDLEDGSVTLEQLVVETIEFVKTFDPVIPVIAAGGIFDGADIARFLELGASGVQMATRFVCTEECDVHENFKAAYISAAKDSMQIISSPVGMPARCVGSEFVDKISLGTTAPFTCRYQCLKTCNPATAPYCIARVLSDAANGNMDCAFAFGGSNAPRCTEILPVAKLVEQLVVEASEHYMQPAQAGAI